MVILDINGMYMWDNTIFDNMVIPTDVNRQELIDMIIFDCRELTVTVASPIIMKRAIELWSKKNIYYWNELQKTMHYNYNPIENYDRHEEITDVFNSNNTSSENGMKTTMTNGSQSRVESGSKTTTDELTVAAFNSSSLEPRETHTITETPTDYTTTETPNITTTETPNITVKDDNKGQNKHTAYIHGNIGTVTGQDMIKQQREIIDISLYRTIVNSFKNEFCILIY